MTNGSFHIQILATRLRPVERSLPLVRAMLDAGVDTVRLRDEPAGIRALIHAWKQVGDWDRDRVIVDGSVKIAGSYGIRWIDVPANWIDQTPPFGKFARIGMTVSTVSEAMEAASLGVDLVTFGPVFPSRFFPDEAARGLDELAEVVARAPIPVLAIGGVGLRSLDRVLATGASGIVVETATVGDGEPAAVAQRIVELVRSSAHSPRLPVASLPLDVDRGSSR